MHASTQADFAGLSHSYLWVCGVLFALVVVLVALLLARSRAGRPAPPSRTASHRASVIGLIALVAIAAFLITRTFSVEGREDSLAASTAARVDAIAFQWGWEFDYAGTSIRVIGLPGRTPTLVLPAGKPVEIRLRSRDVLHSFWVPALRFKRDAFPDQATRFDIERAARLSDVVRARSSAASTTPRCASGCAASTTRTGHRSSPASPRHERTARAEPGRAARAGAAATDHKRTAMRSPRVAFCAFLLRGGVLALVDAHRARRPGHAGRLARRLQPALHDARLDDDLSSSRRWRSRSASTSCRCRSARRARGAPRCALARLWLIALGGGLDVARAS